MSGLITLFLFSFNIVRYCKDRDRSFWRWLGLMLILFILTSELFDITRVFATLIAGGIAYVCMLFGEHKLN